MKRTARVGYAAWAAAWPAAVNIRQISSVRSGRLNVFGMDMSLVTGKEGDWSATDCGTKLKPAATTAYVMIDQVCQAMLLRPYMRRD